MTLRTLRFAAFLLACAATGLRAQAPTGYTNQDEDLPCIEQTFSLRVHTTFTPDGPPTFDQAAFEAMVALTNEAFAPICLRFEVCEYLTTENYRYHSHENRDTLERTNIYGDDRRIDVYIPNLDSIPFICGTSSLKGINRNEEAHVAVVNSCIEPGSYELAHRLGHYFGLYHTFETAFGAELADSTNCATAGDLVCDTPADPFVLGSPIRYTALNNPCRYNAGLQDDNFDQYAPHTANIMGRYENFCVRGFTRGQLERMATTYLSGPRNVW